MSGEDDTIPGDPVQSGILVSEFAGWLFKKSHGSVHIGSFWKRRFFILHISTSTIFYYRKEPTPDQRHTYKGEFRVTNFAEPESPLRRPPNFLDGELGFILNTTSPGKSTVLVCAENMHEKSLWITYLQRSLNSANAAGRRLMMQTLTWKSLKRIAFVDEADDNGNNDNKHETKAHSDDEALFDFGNGSSSPGICLPSPQLHDSSGSVHLPHMPVVLIAIYTFNIGTLACMACVSKLWYKAFGRTQNHKLWKWLIEKGAVSQRNRWAFWRCCVGALAVPSVEQFEHLALQPSPSVVADIRRDVDRSFGSNPNKRVVVRRSVCLEDDDLRTLHTEIRRTQTESPGTTPRQSSSADNADHATAFTPSPSHLPKWIAKPVNSIRKMSKDLAYNSTPGVLVGGYSGRPNSLPERMKQSPLSNLKDMDEGMEVGMQRDESPENSLLAEMDEYDKQRKKQALSRILLGLAARFEEVGYCQGLDRIVLHVMRAARCAVSCSSLPAEAIQRRDEVDGEREREVFAFVEAMFLKMELVEMYSRHGVVGLRVRVAVLARLMEKHCPELFEHLSVQGLPIDAFGISWIQTLFLYVEAMPALTIDKIWDIFLIESKWNIIYSVAIAILQISEQDLLTKNVDEIIYYLYNFPDPDVLDDRVLLKKALSIGISVEYISQLELEIRQSFND